MTVTLDFARLPPEVRYEQIATPFEWKFTRPDLDRRAARLDLPAANAA